MYRKLYLIIFALVFCLASHSQNKTADQWQTNPSVRKNARTDAILKSHHHVSKPNRTKSITPVPDKTAYGFLLDNNDIPDKLGMIAFQLPKPDIYSTIMETDMNNVIWTGVYAEDTYYGILVWISASGFAIPKSLVSIDLPTGKRTEICDLSKLPDDLTFADMTYDYSTSTAYATSNSGLLESTLYTFSLKDGSIKAVGKMAGTYMVSLACSYDGQLYGIGTGGGLYKINKNTGEIDLIGNTGYMPWYVQSMEFDHTDDRLYWAGADAEHTFIAHVDPRTAMTYEMGTFVENSQIMGLYIPFTRVVKGAPDKVTGLTIEPGQKGELSAAISWKNPVADPFGNKLSGTVGVRIYRNNELLTDLKEKATGEACTFEDKKIPENGNYTYRLVPYNQTGQGEALSQKIWIGEDFPCAPEHVTLRVNRQKVTIDWSIPAVGQHGGWVNKAKMKYTLTRLPDLSILASSVTATTYVDGSLDKPGKWCYKIVVSDEENNTAETTSGTIVAGPGAALPFKEGFDRENALDLWSIYNLNQDTLSWKLGTHYYDYGNISAEYKYSTAADADDWLITPPFKLEAQHRYRISFDKKIIRYASYQPEKLRVTAGIDPQPGHQTVTLSELEFKNDQWERLEKEFVPDESTEYYFGFYIHSPLRGNIAQIDNVCVEEIFYYDLEALEIKGAESAIVGIPSPYSVKIKNKGSKTVSSYQIVLTDKEGNYLNDPLAVSEDIAPGQTKEHSIKWTPSEVRNEEIHALILLNEDGDKTNNASPGMMVNAQSLQTSRSVTLGKKEKSATIPFFFDSSVSVRSQSIYLASELNSPAGLITAITWYPNFYELNTGDEPFQIYLANTSRATLDDGFIEEPGMMLAYEGTIRISKGQPELEISLVQPFLYQGENLCVYVKKTSEGHYSWRDGFYGYAIKDHTSETRTDNGVRTVLTDHKAMITLEMNSMGANVSGIVTSGGTPVKDVAVRIEETGQATQTDKDGKYVFELVNVGSHHITCSHHDYFKTEQKLEITDTEPVIRDASISRIPRITVRGQFTDHLLRPEEGAKVSWNGYDDYESVTGATGNFTLDNVYATGMYSLSVSCPFFHPYHQEVNLDRSSDLNLGSIPLKEIPYPVSGLSRVENKLTWNKPVELKTCRYDDGKMVNTIGISPQLITDKSLLGCVYPVPGRIIKVKWYLGSTHGETAKKVNLFIMETDSEGKPTKKPLYLERDILSSCDEWYEYQLPAEVEAPGGFFIGVGSSTDYLNLGYDSGTDSEYPFRKDLQFIATDYEANGYMPYSQGFNFMLRADVTDLEPAELPTSPLIEGYHVYRLKEGEERNQAAWNLLGNVSEPAYTDATLTSVPQGYYRYGITALWKGGGESGTMFTDVFPKDMLTEVTMRITSNVKDAKAVAGSEVTLNCDDGIHKYTSTLTSQDGTLSLENVHKGVYTLSVSHPRFELLKNAGVDLSGQPRYDLGTFSLVENRVMPVNLTLIRESEESNRYHLEWNHTTSIFDDFESHPDFELNSPGKYGWQYIDNDKGKQTYVFENIEYPNRGAGMAYMIFNPAATVPRIDVSPDVCAWSGDKYLGSFSSSKNANDDYFVSPELFFNEAFEFTFYARSYTVEYGYERINVGYSKTDTEPGSFTWLAPGDYLNIPNYWNKYDYTIPADARYVTIRCLSDNAFLLMIDDVQIGSETPQTYQTYAKSYNVYLDGQSLGTLEENEYEFTVGQAGHHTVGVEAVYETGVSQRNTISLDNTSSVEPAGAGSRRLVYSGGELLFDGKIDRMDLFTVTGVWIETYTDITDKVSVPSLTEGIYIVISESAGQRKTNKLIIK